MLRERFPALFFHQRLNALGIPFLCGVGFLLVQNTGKAILFLALASVLLTVLSFFASGERKQTARFVAVGLLLSVAVMGAHSSRLETERTLLGERAEITGTVLQEESGRFRFLCTRWEGERVLRTVWITSHEPYREGESRKALVSVSAFDEEDPEGIRLTVSDCGSELLGRCPVLGFLGEMRASLKEAFGESREGAFFRAVLMGERFALSSEITEDFRKTGSSHLLAISGLHFSVIVGCFFWISRALLLPKRWVRFAFFPLILLLILFTGASVSILRAGIMTAASMLALLLRQRGNSVTALVFAAVLLVAAEPQTLFLPSFLYSFSSTFGLVTVAVPLSDGIALRFSERQGSWVRRRLCRLTVFLAQTITVAVCAFLFTLPVQWSLEGTLWFFSPLYAVLLLPLFAPLMCAGFLWSLGWMLSLPVEGVQALLFRGTDWYLELVSVLADTAPEAVFVSGERAGITVGMLGLFVLLYTVRPPLRTVFVVYLVTVVAGILTQLFP